MYLCKSFLFSVLIAGLFSSFCTQQAIASGKLFHPYPLDNTKFIICKSVGNYFVQSCTIGQMFSAKELRCVTGEITTPTPAQCLTPSWIDATFDGVPLPPNFVGDCNVNPSTMCEHWYRRFSVNQEMFIECNKNGIHVLRKCLPGLIWNDQLKVCKAKRTEPINCPVPSWLNPSEIGLPLDVPNVCPIGSRCNIYITYPFDSNKFIECNRNGVGVIKSCLAGFHWESAFRKCTYGSPSTKAPIDGNVQCGPNPCRKSKTGLLSVSEMYHNCVGSNKHFIVCDAWGNMYVRKCGNDLDWSEEAFTCGPGHIVGK